MPFLKDDDPRFALSEYLIAELDAADIVVIGTPMNNFTVPSTLKAWIDHIVRIRRTFRSTPAGKVGLLRDRPVIDACWPRSFPAHTATWSESAEVVWACTVLPAACTASTIARC